MPRHQPRQITVARRLSTHSCPAACPRATSGCMRVPTQHMPQATQHNTRRRPLIDEHWGSNELGSQRRMVVFECLHPEQSDAQVTLQHPSSSRGTFARLKLGMHPMWSTTRGDSNSDVAACGSVVAKSSALQTWRFTSSGQGSANMLQHGLRSLPHVHVFQSKVWLRKVCNGALS